VTEEARRTNTEATEKEYPPEGPRAAKTTMPPPPPGAMVGGAFPREQGKVAPDVPEEVTGGVRRERPPWPAEESVSPEQERLVPGGDPAMRARRFGRRGRAQDTVPGEQFIEDQGMAEHPPTGE
jgi:hypothetical protein